MSETADPKDTGTPSKKREITYLEPEEALNWNYANAVTVGMSIWDIRLRFGFAVQATEESLKIKDVSQVVMSPQHAKALANLLNSRLKKYEEQFGPLPDVAPTIKE
ncbi:MAG: DUF3467 domain-containing protein [Acidobacteriaceae bacterium]